MSYLVLARKYRPQTFAEMIGQEHITDLLKKSIEANRIAHAFLFCGPRGIGKTSCARILAKSLNCQKGPTLEPCGQCSACKEIAQGTSFDVLEIDGASNRGIDEIRTLRENVKFAPSYGRFKIYIVDEVHMLTTEAFNALLKTLEEPPEHVKFIFATTGINKVPSTIISRCQRFDFKRIPMQAIIDRLADICKKENIQIDQEALFAIAKASQGGLRDALSVLDQLSALSTGAGKAKAEGTIQADDVFSMLGMVETQLLFELTDHLGVKNCAGALQVLDKIIDQGKDIKQLSKDLTEHFRNLMVIKVGGKALGGLVDYPIATKELLLTQSEKFSLHDILTAIETLIEAQETSRIMESLRMPLEVAFAKLTYGGASVSAASKGAVGGAASGTTIVAPQKSPQPLPSRPAPSFKTTPSPEAKYSHSPMSVLKNEKGQVDFSPAEPLPAPAPQVQVAVEAILGGVLTLEKIRSLWDTLTHAVSREKMSVATCLQEGSPAELKGDKLVVSFSIDHLFQKESLEDKNNLRLVEKIFAEKLGMVLKIEPRLADDHKQNPEEPLVQSALETFKGKVTSKWHNE